MILIGRYYSPFVRRVAVTMHHYGLEYEHRALRASGDEQDEIRRSNPLGRVPALILSDGEVLSESALILDYLDEQVAPDQALTPRSGTKRWAVLSSLAIATGAAEKSIAVFTEMTGRPEDKRHQPYMDNCARQAKDGFEHLDRQTDGEWMSGNAMSQLDVSVVCYWDFMQIGIPDVVSAMNCPRIEALSARAAQMPAFQAAIPVP